MQLNLLPALVRVVLRQPWHGAQRHGEFPLQRRACGEHEAGPAGAFVERKNVFRTMEIKAE